MTLWGGRFGGQTDPQAWALNASLSFDQRLAAQDVRGSQAWARALGRAGILSQEEVRQLTAGLEHIASEFAAGSFTFQPEDEDIHTAVERRLGELIGPLGGKLHTGRSRNDQVATDLRLWLLEHLPALNEAITGLQSCLVGRAESAQGVLLPGYTHLQRAQPVLLSHWWLSHFWPLQRDRQRLTELSAHTAILPLGAGALAGAPFPVDRDELALELGFRTSAPNSIDAVADRDFVAEFLFAATLAGVHLSKLAEAVILYTSAEFGFLELDDAFATGSSLMPQKKNPDVFELARGKAGTLLGQLTGLLVTLKGLPSAYDKDLQEDKLPLFNAYDTLMALLPVLAKALASLRIHPERMRSALDPSLMATDLADYLVEQGVPFRQAHAVVGQAVQLATERRLSLAELPLEDYQGLHSAFQEEIYQVFTPEASVARRNVAGGTAPTAVEAQLALARQALIQIHLP